MVLLFTTNLVSQDLCTLYGGQTNNFVFPGGLKSSQLNMSQFNGVKIRVLGSFIVDSDIYFKNCIIQFSPGSQIDLEDSPNGPHTLSFSQNCKLFSCGDQWSGIDAYFTNQQHFISVSSNCIAENFNVFLRVDNCKLNIENSTFTGGAWYPTGNFHIENVTHPEDGVIAYNTFNSTADVRTMYITNSTVAISNNTFNGGSTGIMVRSNSNLFSASDAFIGCSTGIDSRASTFEVNQSWLGPVVKAKFTNCRIGIQSDEDKSLKVENAIFKNTSDIYIKGTTFSRIANSDFYDPTTSNFKGTSIFADNTALDVIGNSYFTMFNRSSFVNATGGRLTATGNIISYGGINSNFGIASKSPFTTLTNNNLNNSRVNLTNITSGNYKDNILNNSLANNSWRSITSPGGIYCSNILSSGATAMFFDGNNMNTFLATTEFNNAATGLEINEVIGRQIRRGNQWLGTYSNLGANFTGSIPFNSSFFTLNSQPWRPLAYNPSNLFFNANSSEIDDCDAGFEPPKDDKLTDIDRAVINNTISWQNTANEWTAKWYLCIKIMRYPSLLNDPSVSLWYNNLIGSDVHTSAQIQFQLESLVSESEYQQAAAVLSLPYTGGSLSAYFNDIKTVINPIHNAKKSKIPSILSKVNQLNGTFYIDDLIKKVYKPYLELVSDSTRVLTVSETQLMDSIAHLCPQLHGPAVGIARTFLAPELLFDVEEIHCTQTQTRSRGPKNIKSSDISVRIKLISVTFVQVYTL